LRGFHGVLDSNEPEPSIRSLLTRRELSVVFQPIVDLKTMEIFAYETLVRSKSFSSPIRLVQAAVQEGCMGELGRRIRELAVAGCPDSPVFVNVDPNELDQPWLVRTDDPIFDHEPGCHIEITESVPLSHHGQCHGVLNEIRGRGVRLAVDDLGAGYSNLKYIADLAPEVVKLDLDLTRGLHKDMRRMVLVAAIVTLCDQLDASVVAEGIETPEDLRAVRAAGVRYGQGYYLARPAAELPKIDTAGLLGDVR
jgi:EAL domain-containing protein (putative c-di-GMP-specific phosphodiesterase class I)